MICGTAGVRAFDALLSYAAIVPSLVLCIAGMAGCGQAQSELRPPRATAKLQIATEPISLGVIPLREHVVQIPVANVGSAPLTIRSVTASCACTAVARTPAIAAGTQSSLTTTIHVASPGPGGARLTVYSNDDTSPHTVLLNWFGEHPPSLAPPTVLAFVNDDSHYESEIAIIYATADASRDLKVVRITPSHPSITITDTALPFRKTYNREASSSNQILSASERPFQIACRMPESETEIASSCHFVVEQAGKEYTLVLPITIRRRPILSAIPPEINVTARSKGDVVGIKRRILISCREQSDVPTLLDYPRFVNCTIDAVTRPAVASQGPTYLLEVAITALPNDATGPDGSPWHLTIGMRDDKKSAITIPIRLVTYSQ